MSTRGHPVTCAFSQFLQYWMFHKTLKPHLSNHPLFKVTTFHVSKIIHTNSDSACSWPASCFKNAPVFSPEFFPQLLLSLGYQ